MALSLEHMDRDSSVSSKGMRQYHAKTRENVIERKIIIENIEKMDNKSTTGVIYIIYTLTSLHIYTLRLFSSFYVSDN